MHTHHQQQPLFSQHYRLALLLVLLALILLSNTARSQEIVYYPRAESDIDARSRYPVALLQLCLKDTKYQLEPTSTAMQQARNLRMLTQGKGVDVVWSVATVAREAELRPIRIPIDRGLIGWRLLLIQQQAAKRFAAITQAEQLMPLRAGQGHDWPDREILASNNFTVIPNASYEGLFQMLTRGYIDYFPRSVSEINTEVNAHPDLQLMVEPKLAIHYPAALYYFVNKDNSELANAITAGLEKAIADGSMRRLFNHHYGAAIKAAQLSTRTTITLHNPLLSAETPLADTRYWFTPEDDVQ